MDYKDLLRVYSLLLRVKHSLIMLLENYPVDFSKAFYLSSMSSDLDVLLDIFDRGLYAEKK